MILLGILVWFFPILIAGYNTMPAAKKKNVDVRGLKRFMCLSLVILGIGWLVFPPLFHSLGWEKWAEAFIYLWTPALAVFMVIKAQKYDRNGK